MKKVVSVVALLTLFSVLLPACGQNAGTPETPQANQPAQTSEPAQSTAPTSQPEPEKKEPLKIGVLLTTSGPLGAIGTKQMVGIEMAVAEVNASGGIMGRQVELITRDDGANPTKALTAAQELVEKEGVTIIIGTTLSSPALAVLPYLTEHKVLLIGSHSADEVNDPAKFPLGFSVSPLAAQQAEVVVKYAVEILQAKKVGLISESAGYGKSAQAAYKQQLERLGVQPVAVEEYPQGALDMSAQLQNLKKAGAEVIISGTLATDSVRILKGMQSMGWSVPFLGNSDLATSAVVDGVGAEGLKHVYAYYHKYLTHSDKEPVPDKTKAFAASLGQKLGQNPIQESILMQSLFYDVVYLLKEAIESANSAAGDKVAAALEQMGAFEGAHASYTFTPNYHGGIDPDEDLVMVKAASFQAGFYERALGY